MVLFGLVNEAAEFVGGVGVVVTVLDGLDRRNF